MINICIYTTLGKVPKQLSQQTRYFALSCDLKCIMIMVVFPFHLMNSCPFVKGAWIYLSVVEQSTLYIIIQLATLKSN